MRFLIIQHSNGTPPGSTVAWLQSKGFDFDICHLGKKQMLPPIDDYQSIIICGGAMNVDQETRFPWLRGEKLYIEFALKKEKKIIGLCLGAQLLAQVLGAKVGPHDLWEVGWHPVELSWPKDFVHPSPSAPLDVFQIHKYIFEAPAGANVIARNEHWHCQGFTLGNQALAVQFHPESTKEWVIENAEDRKLPRVGKCQTPAEILSGMHHLKKMQEWYFTALDQTLLG